MKVSYQWLKELVSVDISLKELTDQLTQAGLEVDSVEPVSLAFSNVVVGEVLEKNKHPDADKLSCCKVNVGNEVLDIVCGAPNVYQGMKVAVALVGATLPEGIKIKKGKLRGQVSLGMLCSERELGLSDEHKGLMDLPKNAPIGEDIRSYLQLDDVAIEVELTPNRADCLSIEGIAREVAALNKTVYQAIDVAVQKVSLTDQISIKVENNEACPKYLGRIIRNINIDAKTPLWMSEKLRRCGIRPISLVVDITNYVMIELGQPMHAFNLNAINGGIVVRMANKSESLTLLDGQTVNLNEQTLVIADHQKVLALAGVMGGLSSSVTDETTDILLESAFFAPTAIAGKARAYGLHTESSHRFERGVDPMLAQRAMERASMLLVELAGASCGEVIAKDNSSMTKTIIDFDLNQIKRLLGLDIPSDEVISIFNGLGFRVKPLTEGKLQVTVPSWRFDVAIAEDLVEEVARLYGYENLPQTLPEMRSPIVDIPESEVNNQKVRDLLISRGYAESITYSFIDPVYDQFFALHHESLKLKNPISSDMAVMRQSLLPGLLVALKNNVHRQQNRIRTFEMGNCFIYNQEGKIKQTQMLAGVIFGTLSQLQWSDMRESDFYDIKNDVMMLLGISRTNFEFKSLKNSSFLHSGRSAEIMSESGESIGVVGQIHPNLQKLIGLKGKAPFVFELDWEKINQVKRPHFKSWSKYPSISRDIAIIINHDIEVEKVRQTIVDSVGDLLSNVSVFDLYQGENVPKNKKSVAFNLILQDSSKTLKDEDINQVVDQLMKQLEENYQATLRE